MLLPALLLVGLFLILPFGLSCWISLTNAHLIPRPVPVKFVGLDNFTHVLTDPAFWSASRSSRSWSCPFNVASRSHLPS